MSGPPNDVAPKTLWQKLQEFPRPCSEPIDFPRKDFAGNPLGQLRMWPLTVEERLDATRDAELFAKKKLKDGKASDVGYDELYREEVCVQILWRACRDVEDPSQRAWPVPEMLRGILTEENAVLFEHYLTTQRKFGPIVAEMSEGDFERWVEVLAKGGAEYPLDLLSADMKNVLLIGMASRLHALRTDTSSAGSPPDETSSGENQPPAAAANP